MVKEIDELLATAGRNRGLVAVMNACYEPGSFHTRKSGGKVQEVHLFGHMILDGMDTLLSAMRPDMRGLVSRCIIIRVRMAPDGYRRPRWDKLAAASAARGRDRLAAWMTQEVAGGMAENLADVPEEIGNPRRCALYEPLFTVAMRADRDEEHPDGNPEGYWSTVLRDGAYQLETALGLPDEDEDESALVDSFMASLPDEPGMTFGDDDDETWTEGNDE